MKLSELLEYCASEVLDDRTVLLAGDADSLYSDVVLTRYLNYAQNRLCLRSWALIDKGHADAGVLVLQTGVSVYKLHPSVLRVLAVVPEDQTAPIYNFDDDTLISPRPDYLAPWPDIDNTSAASAGRPLGFSTETGTKLIRIARVPSSTENGLRLIMRVARLPVTPLTVEDMDAEPEIPAEYHMDIASYAIGRALLHPNVDEDHKAEGKRLLDEFEVRVKEARQDRQRFAANDRVWAYNSATSTIR